MKDVDYKIFERIRDSKKLTELYVGSVDYPWTFSSAQYNAVCTEALPLNPFEKVICGLLVIENSLSFYQTGKILGLNIKDDPENMEFKDPAEYEILIETLNSLYEFGMISREDEYFSNYSLTEIGNEYYSKRKKFRKGLNKSFSIYYDLETGENEQAKDLFSSVIPNTKHEKDIIPEHLADEKYIKQFAHSQIPQIYDEQIGNSFTNLVGGRYVEMTIRITFGIIYDFSQKVIRLVPFSNVLNENYLLNAVTDNADLKERIINTFIVKQIPTTNINPRQNQFEDSLIALQTDVDYDIYMNKAEEALKKRTNYESHANFYEDGKQYAIIASNIDKSNLFNVHLNVPILHEYDYRNINLIAKNNKVKIFLTTEEDIDTTFPNNVFYSKIISPDEIYVLGDSKLIPSFFSYKINGVSIEVKCLERIYENTDELTFNHKKCIAAKYLPIYFDAYCSLLDADIPKPNKKTIERLINAKQDINVFEDCISDLGYSEKMRELDNKREIKIMETRVKYINTLISNFSTLSNVNIEEIISLEEIENLLSKIDTIFNNLQEETDSTMGTSVSLDYSNSCLKLQTDIIIFEEKLKKREKCLRQDLLQKVFIIDTNIFVVCPTIMDYINKKDRIVVSFIVLQELDILKVRLKGKEKENVKKAIKEINYKQRMKSMNFNVERGDISLLPLEYQNRTGDFMILSLAVKHKNENENVFMLTNDLNLQNFSLSLDIPIKKASDLAPSSSILVSSVSSSREEKNEDSTRTVKPISTRPQTVSTSVMPEDLYLKVKKVYDICSEKSSEVSMASLIAVLKNNYPGITPNKWGRSKWKILLLRYPSVISFYSNDKDALCIRVGENQPT